MKQVTIYYATTEVLFNEDVAKVSFADNGLERWREVFSYASESVSDDYDILDSTFEKFNIDEENPLSTELGQYLIPKLGLSHTSMSSGDIVKIDETYYLCERIGWHKLN